MEESTLDKKQRVNLLMDYYEELLTEKQRIYLDYYYHQDYSLSEIAEEMQVSRNAVFDQLKKAVQSLEKYEHVLQLLKKHEERMGVIQQIEEMSSLDIQPIAKYLDMLKNI